MTGPVYFLVALLAVNSFAVKIPHIPGLPSINTIVNGLILKKVTDFYTLNSKAVISEVCQNQTDAYREAFSTKQQWAYRMFDASSKLQSGLYSGNLVNLGAFDQCLQINSEDDNNIKGKYCLVLVTSPMLMGPGTIDPQGQTQKVSHYKTAAERLLAITRESEEDEEDEPWNPITLGLKWSLCIPDGCSAKDVLAHLKESIPIHTDKLVIQLKERQCQTLDSQYKFRQGDWWVIAFLAVILCAMVACTIYDIYLRRRNQRTQYAVLLIFSWYTNGEKLLLVRNNAEQLPCLNGLRFLSMCWVILGHQYFATFISPTVNFVDIGEWMHQFSSMFTIGSTVSVDTFFLLSGCLLMYGYLKSHAKRIPFNIPLFYLHRYLRITPAFAAIILFHVTLMRYVGSGPSWPDLVGGQSRSCEKWWWTSLLYVQNYVNPLEICVSQSWYLQVDMQLFWLSPLVLWPVTKWPKYAPFYLGALIIIFVGVPTYIAGYYELDASFMNNMTNEDSQTKYYMATQSRACTWLVGLTLGYLLFNLKGTRVQIDMRWATVAWTVTAVALLYVLFGMYPNQQKGYVYEPVFNTMFTGLHRTVWSLGVAWIIFACIHGYGGPVNAFLSLPIFQVLSRLTYSMYLTHLTMQIMRSGELRMPIHFSNLDVWFTFWGSLAFDLIIAVIWTMAFEAPMAVFDTILFKKGTETRPAAEHRRVERLHHHNVQVNIIDTDSNQQNENTPVNLGHDNASYVNTEREHAAPQYKEGGLI